MSAYSPYLRCLCKEHTRLSLLAGIVEFSRSPVITFWRRSVPSEGGRGDELPRDDGVHRAARDLAGAPGGSVRVRPRRALPAAHRHGAQGTQRGVSIDCV